MVARADELRDVEVSHLLTFGCADYVDPRYAGSFRHRALFTGPNVREAVNEGRADFVPVFLSEIPRLIRSRRCCRVDVALIHVSPPDEHGFCSYGVGVECTKAAAETAAHRDRPGQPPDAALAGRLLHPRLTLTHVVEIDRPVVELPQARQVGEVAKAIGQQRRRADRGRLHAADGDRRDPRRGAAVPQGQARPGHPHRDVLGRRGGAVRERGRHRRGARPCTGARSSPPSSWARRRPSTSSTTTRSSSSTPRDYVNDPFVIAQNDKMVAINSAIAVDITGQVCADSIGPRDLLGLRRAGRLHPRRVALAGAASRSSPCPPPRRTGTVSRIVRRAGRGRRRRRPRRADVHYVVTEYGVANLHGKSLRERAQALIASPTRDFRDELRCAAQEAEAAAVEA